MAIRWVSDNCIVAVRLQLFHHEKLNFSGGTIPSTVSYAVYGCAGQTQFGMCESAQKKICVHGALIDGGLLLYMRCGGTHYKRQHKGTHVRPL